MVAMSLIFKFSINNDRLVRLRAMEDGSVSCCNELWDTVNALCRVPRSSLNIGTLLQMASPLLSHLCSV